jgi:hypothetical protein
MTPTMRLRFVRRVPTSTDSNPLALMILQQWWEDGWKLEGEWRDVVTSPEADGVKE